MWTREQLKEKGKASFKANFWKAILVALVLGFVVGGGSLSVSMGNGVAARTSANQAYTTEYGTEYIIEDSDLDELLEQIDEGEVDVTGEDGTRIHIDENGIEIVDEQGNVVHVDSDTININSEDVREVVGVSTVAAGIAFFFTFLLLILVAIALAFAFAAFLLNPVEVGCKRFFLCNLNRKAEVKEVAFAFDHNYLTGVKTMFLRDLFTLLWTLLFIIPGIVKSYEYRMIPYIIAENPEMEYKQAFAMSKQMMQGQKWRTFVLDLSFIGWFFLSAITLGILYVFYVGPYYNATCAAQYEALRYGQPQPAPSAQMGYYPGYNAQAGYPYQTQNFTQAYAPAYMAAQPAWATEQVQPVQDTQPAWTTPTADFGADEAVTESLETAELRPSDAPTETFETAEIAADEAPTEVIEAQSVVEDEPEAADGEHED